MALRKVSVRRVLGIRQRAFTLSSVVLKKSDNYYIHKSKIPTLHFQPSLPRLPIPKLEASCGRYLAAQRPILSQDEFDATQKLANEFSRQGSEGWKLNELLIEIDKNNKDTSFIADYWYDMYLKDRRSIVLNHNPFLTFHDDPRNPSQTDRAAQIIWSAVRFYNSLRDNVLRPEVYHLNPAKSDKKWFDLLRFMPSSYAWYGAYMVNAFPLDMVQYSKLFGTTRLPRDVRDELVTYNDSRHIVVIKNDNMYQLDVMEPDGTPIDINHIYAQLEAIKSDSTPSPTHSISLLPTMDRSKWTEARNDIVQDRQNSRKLKKLSSALFVLSLDDSSPTEPIGATRAYLHNYGLNRWVDKSIQFIISANGSASLTFEHAWGDGVAVVRLANEIFDETMNRPRLLTTPTQLPPIPQRLDFNLSDKVKETVDVARQEMKDRGDSLSVNVLQYEGLNGKYLKSKNLSPDATIQLAFQMAYYRQYKTSPSTYESCSTAGFRHGRTETVRPASVATMKCVQGFEPGARVSTESKMKLIKEAVTWHSKLVREAATGQGFDRHLFALKCLAESKSLSLPFFEDPSYRKLSTIILSTSTLATPSVSFGGFAPVNPDSYGVGYRVKDEFIGANVVTYPSRDGEKFISNLSDSLDDLKTVIESTTPF